ncbi:MAG: TetR family transcriptional regulator [Mycobacteriaceae bacterium]|uniref:TetR family transcriptional regulator n=1 Tax=Corynebacterium sp. TaxID=1720 RepID=UPI003F9766A2
MKNAEDTSARVGLRDVTRDAVRSRIAGVALVLFERDGFDAVTVEQIAAEVGMSARSFHRYFPAKEDAVIGNPERYRNDLTEAFSERPDDEPVWESLREGFTGMVVRADEDPDRGRRSVRVMMSTPSLRARNLEKHLSMADALTPRVIERLHCTDAGDAELRAAVLLKAALGCFEVAIERWAASDEDAPALLRQSFDALASQM